MILRRNRIAAWTAILAIALQALWPLVANARPSIAGELVPVCTVAGVTHYIELPATTTPLEKRSDAHGDHCKLCVFGDGKAVVALSGSAFLPVPAGEKQVRVTPKPLATSLPFLPAQPRAPPAVS
jgi:hypothetical protein